MLYVKAIKEVLKSADIVACPRAVEKEMRRSYPYGLDRLSYDKFVHAAVTAAINVRR